MNIPTSVKTRPKNKIWDSSFFAPTIYGKRFTIVFDEFSRSFWVYEWFSESFFYAGTSYKPSHNCSVRNTKLRTPFRQRLRFPVICNASIVSLVVGLFNAGSPTTIFRRIWPIYGTPFYGMFFSWSRTHIGKKVIKRINPPFTYVNITFPIIYISNVIRIVASFFNGTPYSILRQAAQAMRSISIRAGSTNKTSTRFRVSRPKFTEGNNGRFAAFTFTNKHTMRFTRKIGSLRFFYYCKPSKLITLINYYFSHFDPFVSGLVEECKAAMTNCFSGGHPSLAKGNYTMRLRYG